MYLRTFTAYPSTIDPSLHPLPGRRFAQPSRHRRGGARRGSPADRTLVAIGRTADLHPAPDTVARIHAADSKWKEIVSASRAAHG
jgi:hypothetical protein